MSRRQLPRRFPVLAAALFLAAAATAAATALLVTAPASAQVPSTGPSDRGPVARTVIGAASVGACARYASNNDVSDNALASCNAALDTGQLNGTARIPSLNNRGTIHLRRHEGVAALADFDAIVALDRRNAEAHLNRGAALIMLQRAGDAVAAITEALSLGVREPHKAYFNRGAAREALGDIRGAYEDYNTALEIQPDWGPANAEVARFVRTRRDHLATVLNVDSQGTSTATPPAQHN